VRAARCSSVAEGVPPPLRRLRVGAVRGRRKLGAGDPRRGADDIRGIVRGKQQKGKDEDSRIRERNDHEGGARKNTGGALSLFTFLFLGRREGGKEEEGVTERRRARARIARERRREVSAQTDSGRREKTRETEGGTKRKQKRGGNRGACERGGEREGGHGGRERIRRREKRLRRRKPSEAIGRAMKRVHQNR